MKKKSIFLILIAVLLLLIASVYVFLFISSRSNSNYAQVHLEIESGTTAYQVSNILVENKIINSQNRNVFYLFARFPFVGSIITGKPKSVFEIKRGSYDLSSDMSFGELYEVLSSGRVDSKKVVFPEGLTLTKVAHRMEEAGLCKATDFINECKSKELLEEYNINQESLEGYLFPDTYLFALHGDVKVYIRQMVDNFFQKISSIPNIDMSDPAELKSIVVLASIIEREYRVSDEAPIISSVFCNRLEHGIGLYSCATVEYVITEILHRPHPDIITYDDLEIQSPYNTYRNAGLPPSPISNPGLTALSAAVNPAKTDYYYFRLIDPAEGRHTFSKDLQTHMDKGLQLTTKSAAGN